MKATVKSITGFYEAFVSMFMSKRTWTSELDEEIKIVCNDVLDSDGRLKENQNVESYKKFSKWLNMLLRMGKRHITVLRYLDITIMTEG
ncbi:hypothetical protein JYQ78_13955, partial [Anaerobutyricum hallii]|uniref:hypothetical protein n=1 Tax=Anaerobutyricum hallii TaxID=39488 RepID=UPI001ADD71B8